MRQNGTKWDWDWASTFRLLLTQIETDWDKLRQTKTNLDEWDKMRQTELLFLLFVYYLDKLRQTETIWDRRRQIKTN